MADLPGPYEILELNEGQSVEVEVLRFVEGEVEIHPRYLPPGTAKRVKALRLYVPPGLKPVGTDYWDLTSQTLVYSLLPLLKVEGVRKVKITAHGFGPQKRYSVQTL